MQFLRAGGLLAVGLSGHCPKDRSNYAAAADRAFPALSWSGKFGKTAIHADGNPREREDARIVDVSATGEVDHNLSSKFRLIIRRAQHARHQASYNLQAPY